MAIKESAEGWVRGKPMLAVTVIALVGIVVGGIVGLGIGYKVEQNRTRSDVQRLQKKIKDAGVANPDAPIRQLVGTVSSTSAGTIDVHTTRNGQQVIHATATTPYEKTVPAATADIAVGRRVLVSQGGREVIILPSATSPIGRVVGSVGSDTFTVSGKPGKNNSKQTKVKLASVQKVYELTAAKPTDVKSGALVLAAGRGAGTGGFDALEIIVLPDGSAFAAS